jgi:hypothetical protein
MNAKISKLDDLTIIKGIGPTRQKWLRQAFDVYTYADLAALSPDAIEAQLKAVGRIAPRREIEAWIAQAQTLALSADPTLSPEIAAVTDSGIDVNNWKAFASYVVEFQRRTGEAVELPAQQYRTAVQHMQADIGRTWPGLKARELCAWMLQQVGKNGKQERAEELPAAPKPVVETPLQVVINHISVIQLPDVVARLITHENTEPLQGVLKSGEPFALVVTFELTGRGATEAAKRKTLYNVQFYARNLATGASIHLGDSRLNALDIEKDSYTAGMPNASLPPGLYRLWAVVSLHSRPPSAAHIEVPLLHVV